MSRAWPFEDRPEGHVGPKETLDDPRAFLAFSQEGSEAVVVRIGGHDAQLVLVDGDGAWQRWVYPSMDEALEVARSLGVPVHEGEYPEETRVRMNARRRPPEEFERAAYPEQGRVGPVIPYPENRPRVVEAPPKEADRPGG